MICLKVMAPTSIPVFLKNAGIGIQHGPFPPQIRDFDVYYKFPIIVGFHVIGQALPPSPIQMEVEYEEYGPKVVSFYAQCEADCAPETSVIFVVETPEENAPKIITMYAQYIAPACSPDMFTVQWESEGDPKIISFYAEGLSDDYNQC